MIHSLSIKIMLHSTLGRLYVALHDACVAFHQLQLRNGMLEEPAVSKLFKASKQSTLVVYLATYNNGEPLSSFIRSRIWPLVTRTMKPALSKRSLLWAELFGNCVFGIQVGWPKLTWWKSDKFPRCEQPPIVNNHESKPLPEKSELQTKLQFMKSKTSSLQYLPFYLFIEPLMQAKIRVK